MGKHIVFFIKNLAVAGGSERVSTFIANQLIKLGYRVTFIEWMYKGKSFYVLEPGINCLSLHQKEVNIYAAYLVSLFRQYRLLKKLKPDYVIDVCSALSIISIPVSFLLKIKVITWEHFNAHVGWNAFTPKIARTLAARYAHKVVVLTETDKHNYEKLYKAGRVEVIPNPVTIENYGKKADLNAKKILAAGRFTYQKGFDMLLKAFALVHAKHPDWQLTIAGEGELLEDMKLLAQQLSINAYVNFIGTTTNMHQYYQESSMFVLSSRFEGLPLVLIEAQAFGLPVVSFDCPTGPRDIIAHKNNGLLVEPENIDKLATAVINMIEDQQLREKCAANALKKAEEFSISQIITKWTNILA